MFMFRTKHALIDHKVKTHSNKMMIFQGLVRNKDCVVEIFAMDTKRFGAREALRKCPQ